MAAQNNPAHGPPAVDHDDADRSPGPLTALLGRSPRDALRALAFWTAVVLPFLHVPLLATGLGTPGERTAFVALLALNALAAVGGHGHAAG